MERSWSCLSASRTRVALSQFFPRDPGSQPARPLQAFPGLLRPLPWAGPLAGGLCPWGGEKGLPQVAVNLRPEQLCTMPYSRA